MRIAMCRLRQHFLALSQVRKITYRKLIYSYLSSGLPQSRPN